MIMYHSVPNVDHLVAAFIKMDLREQYIEARVLKYFIDFDNIVEDHGLSSVVGACTVYDKDGRQRMKARCQLLLSHVQTEV
ncbi:hypothetical protein PsorP6_013463 [Peronosclerospora sorghi]|uniref:Uncharacterized protein n=1 Tax=Peronosclerospora sorghi TaxID=230839 RepID=A0ACC0VI99_9STRA|nr:hypothetical protein PsorP6_013463 [Peronosclerospora sorghi]